MQDSRRPSLLRIWLAAACLLAAAAAFGAEPVKLLNLPGIAGEPGRIEYGELPRVAGTLAVVSGAEVEEGAAKGQ
ncbi:MAG TPA: hypothetical protein VFV87_05150, partial [Pirellulaceae bacterium]|nr:hypothetical protein [Pirellulaceae bacterium]